jgi:hypothetical protein
MSKETANLLLRTHRTKQIQAQRNKNPNDEVEAEGNIQRHTKI